MDNFSDFTHEIDDIQRDRDRYRSHPDGQPCPYPKWMDPETGQHFWEGPDGKPTPYSPHDPRHGQPLAAPFSVDSDGYGYAESRRNGNPFSVDADGYRHAGMEYEDYE